MSDCRLLKTTERGWSVQTILNINNARSVILVNFSQEKQNVIIIGGKFGGENEILVRKERIAN